ncbi:MAG TPA: methyltransferase domain-containing protein [Pyrinomonadaceae bacterium]|nr:methyltransferase domain-containing protein [Pyrinomonadaceae bacterium]
MSDEYNQHYALALYYDIAFSRDVSREVAFMEELFARRAGRRVESFLELGCGPGYHARAFARRGLPATFGLDLAPEMIALACERARDEGARVEWLTGDMRDFRLREPVDLVACPLDGVDCLLTDEDLRRHFRAVAANLKPDGLYLLDVTHPRDCSVLDYGTHVYEGERDGCRVTIEWGLNPSADLLAQVVTSEIRVRVRDGGGERVYTRPARERILFAREVAALAEASGALEVCGWFGDYDLARPFDNSPDSRRMIVALRRRDAAPEVLTHYFSPKLTVRPKPEKGGHSVFARERVGEGETLVVWGGRLVDGTTLSALSTREQWHSLQVERDLFLAPVGPPEPGDYVCHSCDPNAGLAGQITLVALRDIEPGEEVCFDYAMSDCSDYDEFECACGSPGCRLRVTGEDWRRPDLQARYAGSFSPYLQRLIAQAQARGG